ncbi:hypothetical protein LOTGIDRAFT_154629 [Lottia gigantea]|uniref:Uncharacterized protein n=1 Tax=Lottia gigantea TaxID=225164 RepID=V4BE77_LOTGI|nr:hypothetical protein LOTGIDRAFT_154629 [Lottia gigantea]ESO87134.1 hypothetical protein LOTGIDRAFT_154629 [Lottia gigantea]
MAASSSSRRKRVRSDVDEDGDESLPISKRINGLHIQPGRNGFHNNNQLTPPVNGNNHVQEENWHQQASEVPSLSSQLSPLGVSAAQHSHHNINNNVENGQSNSSGSSNLHPDLQGYDPELKSTDNPHYFQINEVLFRAHVERQTRINPYFNDT